MRRHLSSIILCSSVAAAAILNVGILSRDRERETEGKTEREQQAFWGTGASVSVSVLSHRLTRGSSGMWTTLPGFVILQGPL